MSNGAMTDGKATLPVTSIGTAAGAVLGTDLDKLNAMTATAAELNVLAGVTAGTGAASKALVAGADGIVVQAAAIPVAPGAGAIAGTGAIVKGSIEKVGGIIKTSLLIDLTGQQSSTTDLDVIGSGASPSYLTQLTAALNGTVFAGRMTCLEVPATGVTDIDVQWSTAGTLKFDDALSGNTSLLSQGGAWTLALTKAFADPVGIANGYIYLCNGTLGTVGTYTAGKFLIEFFGY